MAQKIFNDKIGTLTHSVGNIIMAASIASPAFLTIGGQQYQVTSQLSVALPTLIANTRYQVFAVQTAGVVSLVISQNENSVGPAGFLSWKLVGSLLANGAVSVAFGGFINIEGVPRSQKIDGGPLNITADSGGAVKGTTRELDTFEYYMLGDLMVGTPKYGQTNAGSAGSGAYKLNMPTNLVIDSNKTPIATDVTTDAPGNARIGFAAGPGGHINVAGQAEEFNLVPVTTTSMRGYYYQGADAGGENVLTWSSGRISLAGSPVYYAFYCNVYIVGWSNTPIEER